MEKSRLAEALFVFWFISLVFGVFKISIGGGVDFLVNRIMDSLTFLAFYFFWLGVYHGRI